MRAIACRSLQEQINESHGLYFLIFSFTYMTQIRTIYYFAWEFNFGCAGTRLVRKTPDQEDKYITE